MPIGSEYIFVKSYSYTVCSIYRQHVPYSLTNSVFIVKSIYLHKNHFLSEKSYLIFQFE